MFAEVRKAEKGRLGQGNRPGVKGQYNPRDLLIPPAPTALFQPSDCGYCLCYFLSFTPFLMPLSRILV